MTTPLPGYDPLVADAGQGTPLILMHGTLMDHRMFEPQLSGLSHAMRVIAYDSRARSSAGASPYTLADLADDCVRVLDDRGIDRAVVGGMSMGAFAALRVALRHPERVSGLVLIGGQAMPFTSEEKEYWGARYSSRQGEKFGDVLAEEDAEFNFDRAVDAAFPQLRNVWRERFADCDGTNVHHEVQSWIGMEDVREQLSEIKVPTLVIHGDRDSSIPLGAAIEMCGLLPGSQLVVLTQTGHAANMERPEEVNSAILNFMESVA